VALGVESVGYGGVHRARSCACLSCNSALTVPFSLLQCTTILWCLSY
jgi:hypothetical protein